MMTHLDLSILNYNFYCIDYLLVSKGMCAEVDICGKILAKIA